jgi:hypothetical protein
MTEKLINIGHNECQTAEKKSWHDGGQYEIIVQGHIDRQWASWFGDLSVSHDECEFSIIFGYIADQSALHGVLAKIRDLGLLLISVSLQISDHGE